MPEQGYVVRDGYVNPNDKGGYVYKGTYINPKRKRLTSAPKPPKVTRKGEQDGK